MNKERIESLLKNNRFFKIAEILLVFGIGILLILGLQSLIGNDPFQNQAVVWLANMTMMLLIWLGVVMRKQRIGSLGLTFGRIGFKQGLRTFLNSILVAVLAILGFVLGSIIMANITGIPEGSADLSGYDFIQENFFWLFLMLVAIFIGSSFGEEVIYRGFLMTRILELVKNLKAGKILAILISALIFGLIHYSWGLVGMVQTFFMGLVLGICFLWMKRRLWILILAHAYMDLLLILQLFFQKD